MLIFWEKRLVFLATPKAGSTAVEAALESLANVAVQRPSPLKHTDLQSYRLYIEPWLRHVTGQTFTTVALMREPVGWLQSWYRFLLRDDIDDPDHAINGVSFAEFARTYADPASGFHRKIRSQAAFLTHGEDHADRIFRYEDMEAFTDFLEDSLDCAISLPRLNVPPAVDVSMNQEQESTLQRFMRRDIELYASL
ncbi:sulfotransferase family 2 domain-containing protein [Paracoccus aestuariivivens]|uniref:Sulfotransferase family protein n=1 Tax=Paracoccus aestuariivivens TaxID=1820333 RepID=A0A6L6J5F3_9RHOB|nr:sulfotransferase family 2 domain-containing protein [Paracoccus aestuariivivens]MTH76435.1 hypothetical protein [Paracoccus aestuariivivens]